MDDGLSSPPPARETAVLPEGVKECPGEETARSKAIAFVSKFLRYFLLLGCVSAWQAMGMLLQSIESPPSFLSKKDRKPYKQYYFMTWCVHNGFLISLIVWYVLRTKYYNLTVTRAQFHRHLLIASSIGSCMSLMGTMMWYYSLDSTVLSANSAMFQTTPLFVFLFSIKLLGEAVTRSKVVAFLIFTVGITCVTVFTKSQVTGGDKQESTPGGYLLCLLSVLLYAGYEVFYAWQEKVLEQKNAATKAEPEERNEIMDSLLFVVSTPHSLTPHPRPTILSFVRVSNPFASSIHAGNDGFFQPCLAVARLIFGPRSWTRTIV
jgi:drug/metabolite transporter (DMT)-like permease